jgi:uncharacterized protein (DUF885 family)
MLAPLLALVLAGDVSGERFARLALACVGKEYPNKVSHVLNADADALPPRRLTPSFFGCYDWHSAVHGHWLLARLARLQPDAPFAAEARAALARSLTAGNVAAEVAYLQGEGRATFERPYGLAWLLQLASELREWGTEESRTWSAALAPLERAAAARIDEWLPKLTRPIRSGEHAQTAFALGLVLDWARRGGEGELADRVAARVRGFYAADRDCPLAYEPSGEDFLSPCLAEADLMRRVLRPSDFGAWLRLFLPAIPRGPARRWLEPAVVTDPSDPRLAHLDGLNLSRAWMLEGIASGLSGDDARLPALRAAAASHREAGLRSVTGEHYEGGHWLGTFAVYLVSGRGTGRPVVAAAGPSRTADPAALQQLFQDAWESDLREDPVSATRVGDHRYDDRLAGATVADYERRAAATRAFLDRLRAIDRAFLGPKDRVSYDVFRRLAEDSLAEFEHRAYLVPITNREGFHVDFARLPGETRFANTADYEHYIARLRAFPEHVRQQIATMRQGIAAGYTLPRVALEGVEGSISAHVKDDPSQTVFFPPFRSFPSAVAEADRERLTEAGRRAIAEAVVPAYREFLEFVRQEYVPAARAAIGASALPNGRAFYQHRVRQETTLDVTPEEVHRTGLAEVERIRREMQAVIDKVGFRGSFREFLESLRTDPRFYVDTPDRLLSAASWICKRMDGELPRLFLRLPKLPYGIAPIPDFIAPKTTGAYYGPGSGDGTRAGTYFVNTYDLKSRPLYVLEALSFHESVPGHHLQIALQQEMTDLPTFRRFASFTAFVEGWGLYAERLGLEVGFYKDPYSDFGRLTYEIWRACRLVVDTGIHALGWTRQQAIDFMTDNTALSHHEVATEVDRYIAWPGQALGYKMGELRIRELRAKAEAALGPKFDVREFHDAVLRNGPVPLGVLDDEVAAYIQRAR